METITANVSGRVRSETWNGRSYLVAPVTMIVSGVLAGSHGPLYYPPEEVTDRPGKWDGTPLVVYHPTRNGRNVSANAPGVLDSQGVGLVRYSERIGNKLKGEAWFDAAKTKKVDPRVYDALKAGKQIEISTGLFTENTPAPPGATDNKGRPYTWVARNYKPDHLAILPDQVGACSLNDGCGILANRRNENSTSEGGIMGLSAQERAGIIEELVSNCDCWKFAGDRNVLNGFSDDKLQYLLEHAQEETRAVAVANAAVAGFQDGSGRAFRLNPETGKWEQRVTNAPADDEEEAPPKKGKKKMVTAAEDDEEDAADGGDDEDMETNLRRNRRSSRPRTTDEWFRNAPEEVRNTFRYAKGIETREKETLVSKLLINVAESERPAHREWLMVKSLDDLNNMVNLIPKSLSQEDIDRAAGRQPSRRPVGNNGRVMDEDMLVAPTLDWQQVDNQGRGKVNSPASAESGTPIISDEEWLNNAPAAIRATVQNAAAVEHRERRKLIDEIIENVNDEDMERKILGRLQNKTLDELKDFRDLLQSNGGGKGKSYFGAASPPHVSNSRNDATEDVLPLPTMDWGKTGSS